MPTVSIPGGPRAHWGARRRSRVRITHRLGPFGRAFRFTLDLPRECFGGQDMGVAAFQAIGIAIVEAAPKLRGGPGVVKIACHLPDPSGSRGHVELARRDFPLLEDVVRQLQELWGEAGKMGEALGYYLYAQCCTDFVATLIRTPPRRGGPVGRRLTLALPAGLAAAHMLVAKANEDQRLGVRIAEIIAEDPELNASLRVAEELGWNRQQALVVGLVDRAFRGAWEKAGHPGVIYTGAPELAEYRKLGEMPHPAVRYRDLADVLREYLYGQRREAIVDSLLRVTNRAPALLDAQLHWAGQIYLGKPGAAAKAFRLL